MSDALFLFLPVMDEEQLINLAKNKETSVTTLVLNHLLLVCLHLQSDLECTSHRFTCSYRLSEDRKNLFLYRIDRFSHAVKTWV